MLILNVEFAGSLQINANDITFQYTGENPETKQYITGVEWNELTNDEKSEYIVESMVKSIQSSIDEEWQEITVSVNDDEN